MASTKINIQISEKVYEDIKKSYYELLANKEKLPKEIKFEIENGIDFYIESILNRFTETSAKMKDFTQFGDSFKNLDLSKLKDLAKNLDLSKFDETLSGLDGMFQKEKEEEPKKEKEELIKKDLKN